MLLVGSVKDLEVAPGTRLEPAGVYYDEVELCGPGGFGLDRPAHVRELCHRSEGRIVAGARFEFRPGRSHPSYGCLVASVTGDEYRTTPPGRRKGRAMKNADRVWAAKADLDARCPPAGSRWVHVKSDSAYTVVTGTLVEATLEPAVAYRSDTYGVVWTRPLDQFLDGRFVPLPDGWEPKGV